MKFKFASLDEFYFLRTQHDKQLVSRGLMKYSGQVTDGSAGIGGAVE